MDLIELASANARARISRRGAQVIDAQLADRQLLWRSPQATVQTAAPDAAVRGGVPLCFPWFGKHPEGLPSHGFARNREWQLVAHEPSRAVLALDDDARTRSLWPHRFHAEMAVGLDDALNFEFTVTNTDAAPFDFTYALHTYFAVGASQSCGVDGLDGRTRREEGHVTMAQRGRVTFDKNIDAVFEEGPDHLVLHDADRRIAVDAQRLPSTVIWNPGVNDIPDIGDHWPEFVCIERGCVGVAQIALDPGRSHHSSMRLRFM